MTVRACVATLSDFPEQSGARLLFPLPSGARGRPGGMLVLIASSSSWNYVAAKRAGAPSRQRSCVQIRQPWRWPRPFFQHCRAP